MSTYGIPQALCECFADMFYGMNKIALLFGLESNFRLFRRTKISFTSQPELEESDADIVLDWNTCALSIEMHDNNEDNEVGYEQMSFEKIENITGDLYIIPKCPLHRMRSSEFYASGHETFVRILSQHGYFHMMRIKGQSSSVTKSEFEEAVRKIP